MNDIETEAVFLVGDDILHPLPPSPPAAPGAACAVSCALPDALLPCAEPPGSLFVAASGTTSQNCPTSSSLCLWRGLHLQWAAPRQRGPSTRKRLPAWQSVFARKLTKLVRATNGYRPSPEAPRSLRLILARPRTLVGPQLQLPSDQICWRTD